jgi:hypothetical protein
MKFRKLLQHFWHSSKTTNCFSVAVEEGFKEALQEMGYQPEQKNDKLPQMDLPCGQHFTHEKI